MIPKTLIILESFSTDNTGISVAYSLGSQIEDSGEFLETHLTGFLGGVPEGCPTSTGGFSCLSVLSVCPVCLMLPKKVSYRAEFYTLQTS